MSEIAQNNITLPFIRQVGLRNYKSIASCSVNLSQLSILVGPNGAGKSNFLDSLRFVSDSLQNSLEYALRERGGIKEVRRRSKGHPTHFEIRLEMTLPDSSSAIYAFRIGASKAGGFRVQREKCEIKNNEFPAQKYHYHVENGQLIFYQMQSQCR